MVLHGKLAVVPGQAVGPGGALPDGAERDRGRRRRGRTARASLPEAAQPLPHDDLEDPPSVPDRVQVTGPEDAGGLVAGHLVDLQAGLGRPDVHQRLDLEARAVADFDGAQVTSPERVVAVAQVGEMSSEHPVDQTAQQPVSVAAHAGDVIAAAAAREARALGVVGAGHERADEPDYLRAVGGSVRVDHHEDVTGRGREAMRKVSGLVSGRDDDADGWRYRKRRGDRPVRRRPAGSGRHFATCFRRNLTSAPGVRQVWKYHLNRNLTRAPGPARYARI